MSSNNVVTLKKSLRFLFKQYNKYFIQQILKYNRDMYLQQISLKLDELLSSLASQTVNHILVYKPFVSELPILDIFNQQNLLCKQHLYYPDYINNMLVGKSIETDFPKDITEIDIIITPGLFIDEYGYRLGRGGGFYDKLLSLYSNKKTIFVGYSWQFFQSDFFIENQKILSNIIDEHQLPRLSLCSMLTHLPIESHDISIGYLVTEKEHQTFTTHSY